MVVAASSARSPTPAGPPGRRPVDCREPPWRSSTPAGSSLLHEGLGGGGVPVDLVGGLGQHRCGGRLAVEAAKAVEQIVLLVLQGPLQLAGEGGLDLGQGGLAPLQQASSSSSGSPRRRWRPPRRGRGAAPIGDSGPAGGSEPAGLDAGERLCARRGPGVAASSGPAGASAPGACTRVGPGCGSLSARSDRPARIRAKSRSTLLPRPEAPARR